MDSDGRISVNLVGFVEKGIRAPQKRELISMDQCLPYPADGGSLIPTFEIVLPDSQHTPSIKFQSARHETIASLVPGEFGTPEGSVRCWLRRVPWAPVPKAPVNKYSQTIVWEQKVRLAKHSTTATPTSDPVLPK